MKIQNKFVLLIVFILLISFFISGCASLSYRSAMLNIHSDPNNATATLHDLKTGTTKIVQTPATIPVNKDNDYMVFIEAPGYEPETRQISSTSLQSKSHSGAGDGLGFAVMTDIYLGAIGAGIYSLVGGKDALVGVGIFLLPFIITYINYNNQNPNYKDQTIYATLSKKIEKKQENEDTKEYKIEKDVLKKRIQNW